MKDSARASKDSGLVFDTGSPFDRAMNQAQPKQSFGKMPAPKAAVAKQKAIAAALQKVKNSYVYSSGNLRTQMAQRGPNKMIEA